VRIEVVIAFVLAVALALTTLVLALVGRASDDVRAVTTVTVTKTTTVSDAATNTQSNAAGPEKVSFSGNGDATLPPILVPGEGTTLRWTNDGAVFSLFTERGAVVDSVAPNGTTFLPGGRHVVEIIANGNWTITIASFRRAG
jgi:hypothetical protein